MTPIPKRGDFEAAYAGQAPWDIGKPKKAFVDAADRVRGAVLDAGCGTGEHALFFAERGHAATGPAAAASRPGASRPGTSALSANSGVDAAAVDQESLRTDP